MIACELCSGRHQTSVCVIGKASIEACMSGTPDDYQPVAANVIVLQEERDRRAMAARSERRAIRHRRRALTRYRATRLG